MIAYDMWINISLQTTSTSDIKLEEKEAKETVFKCHHMSSIL